MRLRGYKEKFMGLVIIALLFCLGGCNIGNPQQSYVTEVISFTELIPKPTLNLNPGPESEQMIAPVSSEQALEAEITQPQTVGPQAESTQPQPQITSQAQSALPTSDPATELTCTISVSCTTILGHMDQLDQAKWDLVPDDGWILRPTKVIFSSGESVFAILQRTMRSESIHMEYVNTPIYNSAYIEGINNLYEFDVGDLSGWMYKVNDVFPNYGCSLYEVQDGDIIEWVYTCDLGADVGGGYATAP